MDKFKVGDKVRIIECSSESIRIKYINRIATIIKLRGNGEYIIDLDNGVYFWYDSELELAEQLKEYTIHNLMEFPEGTEFISKDTKYKIFLGRLHWYNTNMSTSMWVEVNSNISLKEILDMKFTKVEELKLKAMTFEEAIASGNKIRYEYKDEEIIQENFLLLDEIMESLSLLVCWRIARVILKGTWYAEGVYE